MVTKTLEANAGSIPILLRIRGIIIPEKPATTIFKTIASAKTIPRAGLLNQKALKKPKIKANNTPFKKLTKISLFIILL